MGPQRTDIPCGKLTLSADAPTIIAEVGQCPGSSPASAIAHARAARDAGADAVKFQILDPDKLVVRKSRPYWSTHHASQHDAFTEFGSIPRGKWAEVKDACDDMGIEFLFTPFDLQAVELGEELGVHSYKIASGDITFPHLIKEVASTRKPLILSTGASTIHEVRRAVAWAEATNVVLLACTLCYPTMPSDAHLSRITTLLDEFPSTLVGYSDHTRETFTALGATVLGACVLEKHFTNDRAAVADDSDFALNPDSLTEYIAFAHLGTRMRGSGKLSPAACETPARIGARRSIVAARDIQHSHPILESDLTYLRPGTGLAPFEAPHLVGLHSPRDLRKGDRF